MIAQFLEWAEELDTKHLEKSPIICFATNYIEEVDPAVQSNVRSNSGHRLRDPRYSWVIYLMKLFARLREFCRSQGMRSWHAEKYV